MPYGSALPQADPTRPPGYAAFLLEKQLEAKAERADLYVQVLEACPLDDGSFRIDRWRWTILPPGMRPDWAGELLFFDTSRWGRDA